MEGLHPIVVVLLGLIVGSFLNVVAYRLPRGQSVVMPRSHCTNCGRILPWYENIPLLSFILLMGRCRRCRKPIALQYPIIEALTAFLSYLTYWKFGISLLSLLYFVTLITPLIAISAIDLKYQIIPDVITLPGIAAGLGVSLMEFGPSMETLLRSFWGTVAGGGTLLAVGWLYEKTRKREGLGMGDVKLAAMLGAFFGWKGVFLILLLSSLLGSVVGLFFIVVFRKGLKFALPYGPFLSTGAIANLFFGPELLNLYLDATLKLY